MQLSQDYYTLKFSSLGDRKKKSFHSLFTKLDRHIRCMSYKLNSSSLLFRHCGYYLLLIEKSPTLNLWWNLKLTGVGYVYFRRPWYRRTSSTPWRTSISTPYMDAAGVGKIVTISQAVFEGMTPRTDEDCFNITQPLPGGCVCEVDTDCISRK